MSNSGGNDLVRKQVWAHDAKTGKTYLTTRWVKVDAGKEEERHTHTREDTARGLLSLADNIDKILNGTEEEKEALKQKYFKMANTPSVLKKWLGGNEITVRYGVISHHKGKNADHNFTADEWREICMALNKPYAIQPYNDWYNVYVKIPSREKNILIGMEMKQIGRNIITNAARTVFARTIKDEGNVIYFNENGFDTEYSSWKSSPTISAESNPSIPHSTQKSTLSWADIERMSKSIESHLVIYKGHFYIMRTRNILKEVS